MFISLALVFQSFSASQFYLHLSLLKEWSHCCHLAEPQIGNQTSEDDGVWSFQVWGQLLWKSGCCFESRWPYEKLLISNTFVRSFLRSYRRFWILLSEPRCQEWQICTCLQILFLHRRTSTPLLFELSEGAGLTGGFVVWCSESQLEESPSASETTRWCLSVSLAKLGHISRQLQSYAPVWSSAIQFGDDHYVRCEHHSQDFSYRDISWLSQFQKLCTPWALVDHTKRSWTCLSIYIYNIYIYIYEHPTFLPTAGMSWVCHQFIPSGEVLAIVRRSKLEFRWFFLDINLISIWHLRFRCGVKPPDPELLIAQSSPTLETLPKSTNILQQLSPKQIEYDRIVSETSLPLVHLYGMSIFEMKLSGPSLLIWRFLAVSATWKPRYCFVVTRP